MSGLSDDVVQVSRDEWEAMKAMEARLAQLERAVSHGPGRGQPDRGSEAGSDGLTHRRGLLKHGALLAAAAAAGGTALVAAQASPAAATTGTMQFGTSNDAGADETTLASSAVATLGLTNSSNGFAMFVSDGGTGTGTVLAAQTLNPANPFPPIAATTLGINSALTAAIDNSANLAPAISATTSGTGNGVEGQITNSASSANAVYGTTNGTGAAVVGVVTNAASSAVAVGGVTSGTGAAFGGLNVGTGPAVEGAAWGSGPAVVAQVVSSSNSQAAVSASTAGTGAALQGTATGTGSRGGVFAGVAAQARLVPSTALNHPKSGQPGDLFVDSTARLWFCTAASEGLGGAVWKQVQVA